MINEMRISILDIVLALCFLLSTACYAYYVGKIQGFSEGMSTYKKIIDEMLEVHDGESDDT